MDLPNLYTAQEVADYLGLARGTIYSLVSRGELDSLKFGRSRRFTAVHVRDYVNRLGAVVFDATRPNA